jgi:putative tricarboxylic transport membrane protein
MQNYNFRNGDVVSGAVLAALGTYIVIQASIWPYYGFDGPGPGFFPLWYGVLMVVLALGLIVQAARKPAADHHKIETIGIRRAMIVWGAFAVSLALMGPLGFAVSFTLFTMFIVNFVLGRSLLAGFLTGALSAAAFYVLFSVVLGTQLPIGYFGF